MHEKLRKYLEEISRYLAAVSEKEEILNEIKSHILEKAEQEFGKIDEGALVWIYFRSDTLFFKNIDFQNAQSLLTSAASQWYSSALLALLGIGLAAYAVKFLNTSEWVNLLKSGLQLVILGIVINKPNEAPFIEFPYLNLQVMANILISIILLLTAIDFLKSLIIQGRKVFAKKTAQKSRLQRGEK